MSAGRQYQHLSVEDYLAGELVSEGKHEYLGGFVYAMVGARNLHNVISGNVFAFLHARLRGRDCRPYNSDTKIRIRLSNQVRFYYPDVSVICRSNPPNDSFQDEPVVVVEVLSRSTRRIDEGEKKDTYLTIPSLSVYVLVEQEYPQVVLHRRTPQGFVQEVHTELDAVVPLPELQTELPLSEIYDAVEFSPEPDDTEL
jgi:Uma2 family endonuclease